MWIPVLPEGPEAPRAVLIGEEPGTNEVRYGRPQIGPSGQFLERALNRLGYLREEVYLDNALLCRPPENDLDRFNAEVTGPENMKIKEQNRTLPREARLPKIPTPQEACRPHVARVVDWAAERGIPVIALGKLAYWAITGRRAAIEKVRGSFGEYVRMEADEGKIGPLVEPTSQLLKLAGPRASVKVTATVNPAYALSKAAYKEVMERDLERAFRWHEGRLQWEDPKASLVNTYPRAQQLAEFLASGTWWTWDLECTYEGELLNKMRTIGLYSIERRQGMVIPWVSIDGKRGFGPGLPPVGDPYANAAGTLTLANPMAPDQTEADRLGLGRWWDQFEDYHYDRGEALAIREVLIRFFADPTKFKIGHYSGYFDTQVILRHLGVLVRGSIDQILLARIWNSELRRSLYLVGTMLTDVPAWKAAEDDRKIAMNPRTYEELANYQHLDDVVVAKTGPILIRHAQDQRKWPVAQLDHEVQAICREMRDLGLNVDEGVRAEMESDTRAKLMKERKIIRDIAGADFNPNSVKKLGKLLYDDWNLPCTMITKSGQRSTSEDAIRLFLTTPGLLDMEKRIFLETLWRSRGVKKDLDVLLTFRRRSQGGLVYEDGILRPGYGAHIPATGRMSSFDPNVQNIKLILRKIVRPRKGNLFLQADYDQIELRMFSALAGILVYLKAFADGGDPHAVTALLIYGSEFEAALEEYKRLGKGATRYVALRRFAKTFVYCVLYGGTEQTAYEAVSKATDPDTGELMFPGMTFHQVAACVRTWMRNAPQVLAYWERVWRECELNGYVEEPILGRRRHMPAFERNEALNHGIQGGAGIVMSQGLVRMREVFIPDLVRGTGIVNQMHDAATIEVREEDAERLRPVMEERMTASYPKEVPGVTFSTKAVVTLDFAETKFRYEAEHQKAADKVRKALSELKQDRETLMKIKGILKVEAETRVHELERDLVLLPAWDISERDGQFALHMIEGEAGKLLAAAERVRRQA